ncbi:uncharacterized protein LOC131687148 [Topomyia yanbarensis]|uniref:uncharacterized protein LOC131687148 n=1 Tax=Topomyia yanbarensis TaxID=2498891 RepID=UPI00273C4EB3|nr:uncharacterized protein LOC131687148 [Topomyia yanbarensis]
MEDDRRMQQLNTRRTTLLASINRADQFLQGYEADRDVLELNLRIENLEVLWQGLEEAQAELEELETTNEGMVRNLQFHAEFEPKLFRIKAGLLSKMPPPTSSTVDLPQTPPTRTGSGLAGLKLPTIALPEFSGDYQDWLAFHDTFHALIHSNVEVADIQKFHYLRAAVKGDAAQVIESISISAANYRLAWEALVSRYSNEYLLKKRHLQAMLETPRMREESAVALHGLVDEFERHTKVLKQLGSAPNTSPFGKQKRAYPLKLATHAFTEDSTQKVNAVNRPGVPWRQFKRMSLTERLNMVNQRRLCFNCLRGDHYVGSCPSKIGCRTCEKRHHTTLHPGYVECPSKSNSAQTSIATGNRLQSIVQTNVTTACNVSLTPKLSDPLDIDVQLSTFSAQVMRTNHMFMLTVVLIIVDAYGQEHLARALLDSASQPNLITERMAQILRLKRKKVNVQLQGPGGIAIRASDTVFTQIRSRKEDFTRDVEFLVLPQVTADLPEQDVPVIDWNIPKDLFMADPHFYMRGKIDMIIGLPHFFACFKTPARIRLSNDLPEMVDSVFGWIVAGSGDLVSVTPDLVKCHTTTVCLTTLEENLERFWNIEELPSRSDYSMEERECEQHYSSTVERDSTGRYTVRIPRHPDFDTMLGESKSSALRRFKLLERRLERDTRLKVEYHRFMQEYITLGHMRLLQPSEQSANKCLYLPHHPVIKHSSTTTKVRVVFDGSVKTSTGFSLNDALRVGPVVQDDLLSIVLRFRTFPVAVVADIAKMYRQVLVHSDDTPYQRIFWRFGDSGPIQAYELLTVTYGLAPSSFLATRTLQQLARDEGAAYPMAAQTLQKGFYVDDCLGGAQSIDEALQLREELDSLLTKGGFTLRKWTSNKLEILQGLEPDQIGTQSALMFAPEESISALGIGWEPETDKLRFDSKIDREAVADTKRKILSSISQLFDPLGLIAPVVIRGKMLMQELWLLHCDWDDSVPDIVQEKWNQYQQQLPKIAEYTVDRYAFLPNSKVQLHTFSDASESAYGACVYARSIDNHGNIRVQLLASKSRVAPLKRITLPRLELCAAVVGSQLFSHVVKALQMEVSDARFWSDSTITIQWLQAPPHTWKTFVANRVSEIQANTHGYRWSHIAGNENPADLVSRGMSVEEFLASYLWKYGPEWLRLSEKHWPETAPIPAVLDNVEIRRVVAPILRTKPFSNPIFCRYSSFSKLVRVTAHCLRFVRNIREKARAQPQDSTVQGAGKLLTTQQLSDAEIRLIQLAQIDAFKQEINDLKMIARHYHLKMLHGGGQLTLAAMREQYWPVHGRRLIHSVIRKCLPCAKVNPVPAQQQTGQLPVARVTPSRPFTVTGIDYAGPLYLKPPHKRAAPTKAYICIFVCFSTKAVHIELVSDLTTSAFLAALRRFISLRGLPKHIHSDNGKNFEGARNELRDLYLMLQNDRVMEAIQSHLSNKGITWHMTPPKAPHFGGLWEAAVKVAKKHLQRQLGNVRLSFEDMATVLSQIEASMNSRPLTPMSEDPSDFTALTPGHFLIGSSMHALPEPDIHCMAMV